MAYVTTGELLAALGARELIEAGAIRDPLRLVSEELLSVIIAEGDDSAYTADEIAAATSVADHVADSCAQADARIDSAIRSRWPSVSLPLDETPADVARIALWLARYFAHVDVSDDSVIARRYREAVAELRDFARGATDLGIAEPSTGGTSDPTYVAPREVFTQTLLDTMP